MARKKDREQALILRKQGKSYSQIKKILGLSKSTLSYWLRLYPLSKERISELRDNNEIRIERYRETMRKKREGRLNIIYKKQEQILLPLSKRDLLIAGIFLYWGEGTKNLSRVSISNTDPAILKFFIKWLETCFNVDRNNLRVHAHLYSDMNIKNETEFWSNILELSQTQFNKPYIKESRLQDINHRGGFGHGTCNVGIGSVEIAEQVLMDIKVIADKYLKMRV